VHLFNVHNLVDGYNRSINVVYWTLAVEFQWYLLAPLFILLFIKNKMEFQALMLLICILISITLRFYYFKQYLNNQFNLPSLVWVANDQLYIHLYNFLLGVFLYQCRNIQIKIHFLLMLLLLTLMLYIGYVQSDLISGINMHLEQLTQYRLILGYIAILALAFLVFAFLNVELGNSAYRLVSFISLVSYSLYLYHLPILDYLKAYHLHWYIYLPVFLFGSVGVASLSYFLVEAPFLRFSSALNRK